MQMAIFDMDGVLVDIDSSWQYVHQKFNQDNQDNLSKYISGEISYSELVKRDVALWGTLHHSKLRQILTEIPLMKGASHTVSTLKKEGYITVIISAGISILATYLQKVLGFDHVFANELAVDDAGIILGKVEREVELLKKVETFRTLTQRLKIPSHECAVVGDSSFDIPLFQEAGLSIAFNSEDIQVQNAADIVIRVKDLAGILPFL
jgi:phosphoserine phosphatase